MFFKTDLKMFQRFTFGEGINFEIICGHINQNLLTHSTYVHVFFDHIQIFRYSDLNQIFHLINVELKCFSVYLILGKSLFDHKIPRQHA